MVCNRRPQMKDTGYFSYKNIKNIKYTRLGILGRKRITVEPIPVFPECNNGKIYIIIVRSIGVIQRKDSARGCTADADKKRDVGKKNKNVRQQKKYDRPVHYFFIILGA